MTNRLIREKSPYLLQHAHNPVDWFPWGEEAFQKAASEDKPVFLSVGYSTCHWCHVMERESFESEAVAEVLNKHFVAVKVDREERPDVDRIYMLFVQATTGSGGWPMSVWLTPDRLPFYGGTYFPPDSRYGRPGFKAVLESLARAWREDRAKVIESGAKVIGQLKEYADLSRGDAGTLTLETLDSAYNAFRRMFDSKLGGFGAAPKFPRPSVHNFLLRYYAATGQENALEMVLLTLREMAKGGMNDQLGGGFHRYSVDDRWFVPHFEKMLYDQAQLAVSYLEAFQISRDEQYAEVARSILAYVARDLGHAEGGFYSAEDADSLDASGQGHKREGAFYAWSHSEVSAILGTDAPAFCARYGVGEHGNVDEDPHGEFRGLNILFQAGSREDGEALDRGIEKLLKVRAMRPRPHLDDKILTGWNALMISAFAKAEQILGEGDYFLQARRAADFLKAHLWREESRTLLRRYRDGESDIEAFLDDYAALITGLLDLYETGFNPADLMWAADLAVLALEKFEDKQQGGFFSTAADQPDLVLRLKDDYDGAEPSGNSVMTLALLRLARFTGREEFRTAAVRTLGAFAPRLRSSAAGLPQMLVAQMVAASKPTEIVLAGPADHPEMERMLEVVHACFLPAAVVMRSEVSPTVMPAIADAPTAYVCENYACQLPVTTAGDLARLLAQDGK